ncbi:unnamed protein product [Gongylonema pulchrum]|uniref:RRM domain-containing protein n=1 Tax=Gongylonema pulchrum TaxID=637853 RepID=A0A3P7R9N8_9BILA|nr:unnamed protein product [Gongylonema pulchrum]
MIIIANLDKQFSTSMGSRVYVGRLSYRAHERDIERFFRGYGRITEILLKNGYAFVEFADRRDAEDADAVHDLNGRTMLGDRRRSTSESESPVDKRRSSSGSRTPPPKKSSKKSEAESKKKRDRSSSSRSPSPDIKKSKEKRKEKKRESSSDGSVARVDHATVNKIIVSGFENKGKFAKVCW